MARIRSIHPALFTDEAFVGLSMAARVLLLGVWTEADDQGVFDWKPVTLKMRIMPVDNVDISALLIELERADVVRKFEQDGKFYGAVRNFCKFQRPKTPKYRQIKSPQIRNYVASSYPITEIEEPQPDTFPQKVEMPSQMEDGGGREGEEESLSSATRPEENDFETLKSVYPRRKGNHGWKAAERKFWSLVKTGVDPKVIIAAAKQLAYDLRSKIGTEFVPMPEKWLASEDFVRVAVETFQPVVSDKISLEDAVRHYARTMHWSRHAPLSDISLAPPELLAKHGLMPDGRRIQ